jgi:hypothetical protein
LRLCVMESSIDDLESRRKSRFKSIGCTLVPSLHTGTAQTYLEVFHKRNKTVE